jgi:hypothetical protein
MKKFTLIITTLNVACVAGKIDPFLDPEFNTIGTVDCQKSFPMAFNMNMDDSDISIQDFDVYGKNSASNPSSATRVGTDDNYDELGPD